MHGLPIPGVDGSGPQGWLCLDGQWQFRHRNGSSLSESLGDESTDSHMPRVPIRGFESICVPGSWMLQGHGIPIYTNVQFPFATDEYPSIPMADEDGDYVVDFDLPADWRGSQERVVLRLGGAESTVQVWMNGIFVGASTDSRLPAEFDVTEAIKAGTGESPANRLWCRVHRWSASTWLEDQDMWWMAGLHRSVWLYRVPETAISDIFCRTLTAEPSADPLNGATAGSHSQPVLAGRASVAIDVEFQRPATRSSSGAEDQNARPLQVTCSLVEDGQPVAVRVLEDITASSCEVLLEVEHALLWTAETPTLYQLKVQVRDESGTVLDAHELSIGLRTVEIAAGQLLVNGQPIVIRGVNRHEHDGWTGRVQSDTLLAEDIALLKASNVNAVRTAHYPNDERFQQLCDHHGLYLFVEANIETHGVVEESDKLPASDPRFAEHFIERGVRMVLRDRNHPSVIVWSLGNESGLGPNHYQMADEMRQLDQTRPIHYHPAESEPLVDIIGPMYPSLGLLERLAKMADERPVIMCEYSHAMGNSNGGLESYWELIRQHRRLAGGFIWDWVDQGLAVAIDETDRAKMHDGAPGQVGEDFYWAYGGDFGDKPNDANFNCNGLVDADRTPHPALHHLAWVYRPVAIELIGLAFGDRNSVKLRVMNRRDHVDLSDIVMRWTLMENGKPIASGGPGAAPEVGPGAATEITLPLPPIEIDSGEYSDSEDGNDVRPSWFGERRLLIEWLSAESSAVVSWDDLALPDGRRPMVKVAGLQLLQSVPAGSDGLSGAIVDGYGVLELGRTRLVVDNLGQPSELTLDGQSWPIAGARLGVNRAPTDNDQATFGDTMVMDQLRRSGFVDQQLIVTGDPFITRFEDVVGVTTSASIGEVHLRLLWLLGANGDLAVDFSASADPGHSPLLRIGLELDLPGSLTETQWYGPGPMESYSDRTGGLVNRQHSEAVGDSFFAYARPQESGNKTDLRWLAVSERQGAGIVVIGDDRFDSSVLRFRSSELDVDHPHQITKSDVVVLRIDAAHSGIGTASCGPGVGERHIIQLGRPLTNRMIIRGVAHGKTVDVVAERPTPLRRLQQWH